MKPSLTLLLGGLCLLTACVSSPVPSGPGVPEWVERMGAGGEPPRGESWGAATERTRKEALRAACFDAWAGLDPAFRKEAATATATEAAPGGWVTGYCRIGKEKGEAGPGNR